MIENELTSEQAFMFIKTNIRKFCDYYDEIIEIASIDNFNKWIKCLIMACENYDDAIVILDNYNYAFLHKLIASLFSSTDSNCELNIILEKIYLDMLKGFLQIKFFPSQKHNLTVIFEKIIVKEKCIGFDEIFEHIELLASGKSNDLREVLTNCSNKLNNLGKLMNLEETSNNKDNNKINKDKLKKSAELQMIFKIFDILVIDAEYYIDMFLNFLANGHTLTIGLLAMRKMIGKHHRSECEYESGFSILCNYLVNHLHANENILLKMFTITDFYKIFKDKELLQNMFVILFQNYLQIYETIRTQTTKFIKAYIKKFIFTIWEFMDYLSSIYGFEFYMEKNNDKCLFESHCKIYAFIAIFSDIYIKQSFTADLKHYLLYHCSNDNFFVNFFNQKEDFYLDKKMIRSLHKLKVFYIQELCKKTVKTEINSKKISIKKFTNIINNINSENLIIILIDEYLKNLSFEKSNILTHKISNDNFQHVVEVKNKLSHKLHTVKLNLQGEIEVPMHILKLLNKTLISGKIPGLCGDETGGPGFTEYVIEKLLNFLVNNLCKNNNFCYDFIENHKLFKYYGIVAVECLYHSIYCNVPTALVKFVMGKTILLSDVIDKNHEQNLKNLLKFSDVELESLDLSPKIFISENKKYTYNLLGCNEDVVNAKNLNLYLSMLEFYYTGKLEDSPVYKNFVSFKNGYDLAISVHKVEKFTNLKHFLILFNNNRSTINKNNFVKHCKFDEVNKKIKSFVKKYVKEISDNKFIKLIEFACGTQKVHKNKYYGENKIVFMFYVEKSKIKLPSSSTCTQMIFIRNYNNYGEFKTDMDIVLNNLSGFGLA